MMKEIGVFIPVPLPVQLVHQEIILPEMENTFCFNLQERAIGEIFIPHV
jgi:hypothetical protein